ncbi:fungal-specific transcription factor domain-containing protein [Thelonectria olida]|uniref:Fungal-specific transcription factor domain-containing protein n=1 Tax=Thelonectria olida TaxID=1576542 RepID=A0A9P8VU03_9HYPO|nr:fungal-specific transcription factor domain-containing protein [Thelonectria olida]
MENGSVSDKSDAGPEKRSQQRFGRLPLTQDIRIRGHASNQSWMKLIDTINLIRWDAQDSAENGSDVSDDEEISEASPVRVLTPSISYHNLILRRYSTDIDLTKYHPLPSYIPYLWYIYQENLEPLIKVVHVPSVEAVFRDARRNPANLTAAQEGLVFAIYYAAIISLDAEEVQTNFGTTKNNLLTQYRFAFEQALSKSNFIQTSNITILQAFPIFLVVLRRHDESRYCWSIAGLLIHLARGLGFHRDGIHLRMGPFETEMRRRIWWQLLILDLRSSEELRTDLMISDSSHDTLMPSNINDAYISPDITEFPRPREGKSDCAVVVIRYETCSLNRRV